MRLTLLTALATALLACATERATGDDDAAGVADTGGDAGVDADAASGDAGADADAGAEPDATPDAAPDVTPDAGDTELPDADAEDGGQPDADATTDAGADTDADPPCPDGEVRCDGLCVDTGTDPAHCGGCGAACDALPNSVAACVEGDCSWTCEAGFHDVDAFPGCEYPCDPAAPGAEVCDGEDNDCDGAIDTDDDDFVPPSCELTEGVCADATTRCVDGAPVPCTRYEYELSADTRPYDDEVDGAGGPLGEWHCDGEDNDCDGATDEGCCEVAPLVDLRDVDGVALPLSGVRLTPLPARAGDAAWRPVLGAIGERIDDDAPPVADAPFGMHLVRFDGREPRQRDALDTAAARSSGMLTRSRSGDIAWWQPDGAALHVMTVSADSARAAPWTVPTWWTASNRDVAEVAAVETSASWLVGTVLAYDADSARSVGVWNPASVEAEAAEDAEADLEARYAHLSVGATDSPDPRWTVCALTSVDAGRAVRCIRYRAGLTAPQRFDFPAALTLAPTGTLLAASDGGLRAYASLDTEACGGSCTLPTPVMELRVAIDGAFSERTLPLVGAPGTDLALFATSLQAARLADGTPLVLGTRSLDGLPAYVDVSLYAVTDDGARHTGDVRVAGLEHATVVTVGARSWLAVARDAGGQSELVFVPLSAGGEPLTCAAAGGG